MIEKIKNIFKYNERMKRGLKDKLFFLKYLKNKNIIGIVDFGCGDAELTKHVPNNWIQIGIDNNSKMRELAMKNNPKINIVSSFDDFSIEGKGTILLLSSVIHEVYSYCNEKEIEKFWEHVFNDGYEYIVIRDMCVSKNAYRKADVELIQKMIKSMIKKLDKCIFHNFLVYFINSPEKFKDGPISQYEIIEFLLKYRYTDNWERESKENYLPLDYEYLIGLIAKQGKYDIVYNKHYILPFIKKDIKKTFNYNLKDNTHVKLILRRKEKCLEKKKKIMF